MSDFEKHRVGRVGRKGTWPRGSGDHALKTQYTKKCIDPNRIKMEFGPSKNLPILILDSVIHSELESAIEKSIDQACGWRVDRKKTGDKNVGVEHPKGNFSHTNGSL